MIKLDDNYYAVPNQDGWVLHFEKESGINEKTGLPVVSKNLTYHGSFTQVMKYYADQCLKVESSITEVLAAIESLNSKITSLCKNIKL